MQELEGSVAIVTGSARNIGRAIALDLAEGGAAVTVLTRSDVTSVKAVAAEIRIAWRASIGAAGGHHQARGCPAGSSTKRSRRSADSKYPRQQCGRPARRSVRDLEFGSLG